MPVKRVVSVAASVSAAAALAVAPAAIASPIGPGPNSAQALSQPGSPYNFGHCQSTFVKLPFYPPSEARTDNPALYIANQPGSAYAECTKDPLGL